MLGYPETCPHGGTIPAKGELLVEKYQLTLDQVENAGTYRLARVHDEFELLKYLEKHDLHLGDTLILEQYDPYAQLHALKVNGKELQVNSVIAQQLYVEKYKRKSRLDNINTLETAQCVLSFILEANKSGTVLSRLVFYLSFSQRFFVSNTIVTGPSLTNSTCISAAKTPVLTGISRLSNSLKSSYN